jgi:hypothetical protein
MNPNRLYWACPSARPNPERLRLPIDNPRGFSGKSRLWDRREFGQQCTRNVLFHISPLAEVDGQEYETNGAQPKPQPWVTVAAMGNDRK